MTVTGHGILGVDDHDHADPDRGGTVLRPSEVVDPIVTQGDVEQVVDGTDLLIRTSGGTNLLRLPSSGAASFGVGVDVSGTLTATGDLSADGKLISGGDIDLPGVFRVGTDAQGFLLFGGGTDGPSMTPNSDPSSFIVFDNSAAAAGKLIEVQSGGGFDVRTTIRVFPGATNPGSATNPAIEIGGGGAGLFVDSGGDLAAVNNDGTSGKII